MIPPRLRFEEITSSILAVPRLVAGKAQLWAVHLNPDQVHIDRLTAHLSPGERERARRYRFDCDRRRFVVRWGFLRSVLGHHLGSPPGELRFQSGPEGKPFLADHSGLNFNLSHSDELALVAVSRDVPLGVDIEKERPVGDADAIVRRLFTAREVAAYFSVADSDRPAVFLNCWTRKEAFVKARGDGLSFSLKLFDVSVLPGESARIVAINGDPDSARGWTLIHLEPAAGFIGAMAMEQKPIEVSAWLVDLNRTAWPSVAPAAE